MFTGLITIPLVGIDGEVGHACGEVGGKMTPVGWAVPVFEPMSRIPLTSRNGCKVLLLPVGLVCRGKRSLTLYRSGGRTRTLFTMRRCRWVAWRWTPLMVSGLLRHKLLILLVPGVSRCGRRSSIWRTRRIWRRAVSGRVGQI